MKTPNQIVRVLIVDDSAYVRKVIKQMLSRSPFIEVVGAAHDGVEALEKIEQLKPDVITVDLIMPEMDGVELLRQQMKRRPIPAIVVSISNQEGEKVLAAMDAGAVDFVHKPTALATEQIYDISDELINKVKTAAQVPLSRLPWMTQPEIETQKPLEKPVITAPTPYKSSIASSGLLDIICIGISTGGPQALAFLIPQLPADLPVAVAVVLHMPVGYTKMYAERLDKMSAIAVIEAQENDPVTPGVVIIAQAGKHLTFKRHSDNVVRVHLESRPFDVLHRPSVDVMFQSAADVYGDRVLGVVMTGMGSDGKQGAAWIKSRGGKIFTEAESSCVVYGMPRSIVEAGLSDQVISLENMKNAIINAIQ